MELRTAPAWCAIFLMTAACGISAFAQRPVQPAPTPAASPSPGATPASIPLSIVTPTPTPQLVRDEPPSVVKRSLRAGGRSLNYTVTTGYLPLKNPVSGETEARIFYMAYTMDDPPAGRPLMFSFNGGPGSSSVWLHLGALGPKRVKMLDSGLMPPPPYELVDNDQTWLTDTDIVFIDPVGTGFSRAAKPELASKYFGLQGDIQSVGDFIRLYLTRNDRWTAPLFLVGESYGTTRASGLSNHLFERGIALNGIILVSTIMNFQTTDFAANNDLPLVMYLPSYAATAWYHKRLSPAMQAKSVEQVAREARDFASKEYMPAMLKIDSLSSSERAALAARYSEFTGLSAEYIDRAGFRIELGEFSKELLRSERRSTGRLDSRFKGIDRDPAGQNAEGDSSMNAIRPPYTAAFNNYVRKDLGFKSDLEYYILGGGMSGPWNWNVNNSYVDTSSTLKSAMAKNPYMKVLLAQGYYDMATPFYGAEYTVSAMNLDPELRRNVGFTYYESGHMMYIEKDSLKKLKDDASAFIQSAIRR